ITYVYASPSLSLGNEATLGMRYAARLDRPDDHLIGVTGPAPAEIQQADVIAGWLVRLELLTILAIALIVALNFGAVGPPLAVLARAGTASVVAGRVVAWVALRLGVTVTNELEPVLVALLLGIATDYTIFYLAGMRQRLRQGDNRIRAAERTVAEFTPIVFTAGLIVTAGTATLLAARLG